MKWKNEFFIVCLFFFPFHFSGNPLLYFIEEQLTTVTVYGGEGRGRSPKVSDALHQ
jgi:hypothetical protein